MAVLTAWSFNFYVRINTDLTPPLQYYFPGGSDGKVSAYNAGDRVQSLGGEDLLEKEMATHSSILAWKIPWTEEPGRLQSMGSQRVGHDWATSLTHFQTQKGGPALGLAGLCRSRSSRAWHVCVSRYSLSGWHLSCLELPEYLLRKILPEKI